MERRAALGMGAAMLVVACGGCKSLSTRVAEVGCGEPDLRREAVLAIGEDRRAQDAPKVIRMLILVARNDHDPMVRAAAARALGGIEGEDVVATLVHVLGNDPSPYVRSDAAHALGRNAHPDGLDPLIDAFRSDADLDVRLAAADGLSGYRDLKAVDALIEGLRADRISVAHKAWESLRYMTGQGLPRDPGYWQNFLASTDEPFARYGRPPRLPKGVSQRPHMTQTVGGFLQGLFEEDPRAAELK